MIHANASSLARLVLVPPVRLRPTNLFLVTRLSRLDAAWQRLVGKDALAERP